jgi:hypothetical protein
MHGHKMSWNITSVAKNYTGLAYYKNTFVIIIQVEIIIVLFITYSMEQSHSWEANRF